MNLYSRRSTIKSKPNAKKAKSVVDGEGSMVGRKTDNVYSHLKGDVVKVGVRILHHELLNGPPGRGGVGDVVAPAFRHPRVKNTDHMTLAIEDERARVALGRERTRLHVIVIDGEFDGLDAEVVAKVGLEAGVASDREVSGVAVLHDEKAGLAASVETVGNSQLLARETTVDTELAIRGPLERRPTTTLGVEHIGELPRSKLGS